MEREPDTKLVDGIRKRHNAGERLDYVFFWGHQPDLHGVTTSCFSQWYEAPFTVDGARMRLPSTT